jgi:hypothetical protein
MSSKSRKHRGRSQDRRPGGAPQSPGPNRNGAAGVKKSSPSRIFFVSLAILAALAVCVAIGTRDRKAHSGQATGSNTPSGTAGISLAPAPGFPLTPAAPVAEVNGPRIRFASLVYDFGKAKGDDLVNCVFAFTNVGNALLEVGDVAPLCGCMKAGEWSRKVEPGQAGTIPIRYDSRLYTGPFAKSINVTCNDTSQPALMLQIKGTVWRPIEITPPSAVLNLSADTPSNATVVRLISHLDEPLTLSDLKCNNAAVSVQLQTNQSGKEYQVVVTTVPPWPTNSQQGQITLKTSTTNMSVIDLKLFVNVLPLVNTIPYWVRLPSLPLTNTFSYTVWIRNNGTNALALSEPAVNAKGVEVRMKEEQPGRQFGVTLTFPSGFDLADDDKVELSVKSNLPQVPVIKVPVVAPPRSGPGNIPSAK